MHRAGIRWAGLRHVLLLAIFLSISCGAAERYRPRDGDLIFHTSRSAQSAAIRKVTHSPYTHMGLVFLDGGRPMVLEAVQPVKVTPLAEWIARGVGGHFVVKRLADAEERLTPEATARLLETARAFLGRPYDPAFEWSDERLYCSELVWKAYKRALGVEIGAPRPIGSFDLDDPEVQRRVAQRWGGPPPAEEPVITPAAMFASERLVTVHEE